MEYEMDKIENIVKELSRLELEERVIELYHSRDELSKLLLGDVSNNKVSLIEPLRNFIRSKHLSSKWENFLKEYQLNQ